MRYLVHGLMIILWGLATPIIGAMGTEACLVALTGGKGGGHSTPLEFLIILGGMGLMCLAVFMLANFLSIRFLLSKQGKSLKYFFLSLGLYVLVCVIWCFSVIFFDL